MDCEHRDASRGSFPYADIIFAFSEINPKYFFARSGFQPSLGHWSHHPMATLRFTMGWSIYQPFRPAWKDL